MIASSWMSQNLPPQANILSEAGNVVNLPLKGNFKVTNLDFYHLDEDLKLFPQLVEELEKSQFVLVPSRRIFANHPFQLFPKTACYHYLLFSGQLGFEKIKKFNSYPSISLGNFKLVFPDEMAEETWTVFDHPVIRIYQKQTNYSQTEYQNLFNRCLSQL
jgi:hypothetical protein